MMAQTMMLTEILIVMMQIVSMIISVLDDVKAMQIVEQTKHVLMAHVLLHVLPIVLGKHVVMTVVVAHVVPVQTTKHVITMDNVFLHDAKQIASVTMDKYV